MINLSVINEFIDLNSSLIFFILAMILTLISFFIGLNSGRRKNKVSAVPIPAAPVPPVAPVPSKLDYQMQGIIPYDDDDDFLTNEKLSIKITPKKLYDDKNIKLLILDDSIDKIFGTTFFVSLVVLILNVVF